MVFMVVISSVLLAVCTSLKPIYLQNAIDAVDAGGRRRTYHVSVLCGQHSGHPAV